MLSSEGQSLHLLEQEALRQLFTLSFLSVCLINSYLSSILGLLVSFKPCLHNFTLSSNTVVLKACIKLMPGQSLGQHTNSLFVFISQFLHSYRFFYSVLLAHLSFFIFYPYIS